VYCAHVGPNERHERSVSVFKKNKVRNNTLAAMPIVWVQARGERNPVIEYDIDMTLLRDVTAEELDGAPCTNWISEL